MLNSKDFEKRVAEAKRAGKRTEIVDGDGLFLDVTATGVTTWRYRYRVHGRREKMTIGSFPKMGLAAAREHRTILAGKVALAKKVDTVASPAQEREKKKQDERAAKHAGTIADLGLRYLAHIRKNGRKANSIEWHIGSYITPTLGTVRTPELTTADVRRLCDKIKNKAPSSAREVLGTLKRMLKHAVLDGLIPSNPAANVDPSIYAPKGSRERSLSPDELRTFLRGCESGGMSLLVSSALQLIVLTLARKNEVVKAPWTEFDLDAATWEIPGDRTKNKKPHMVPLSAQAVAILQSIHPEPKSEEPVVMHSQWVFPGLAGQPLCDSTLNEAIRNADWFGLPRFTIHDLRRTASTILHEQGWNSDVIEKALNHTMRGVRGIYNRAEYLDQRRDMLQAWADYLDALKRGARVVPIGKSKAA